jgi:hypothetical protein
LESPERSSIVKKALRLAECRLAEHKTGLVEGGMAQDVGLEFLVPHKNKTKNLSDYSPGKPPPPFIEVPPMSPLDCADPPPPPWSPSHLSVLIRSISN